MSAERTMELVRDLVGVRGRWPGTDAERRAANLLVERVRAGGRWADVEPTWVHPEYSLVHAVHVVLALAGSLLAVTIPAAGFALILFALVSMFGDLTTRFYLVRRLFFRRASQNVVSPGPTPEAPARLVISAHYDAAKTGLVFQEKRARRMAALQRRLPILIGPFFVLFWGTVLLLALVGLRMAGLEADWISVAQLLPTILLIVAVPLLIDIALSEVVPGANDNASGVAAAIELARELDAEPPENLDVWLVLTGGEECLMQGMRSLVRQWRREWERERTFFLNLDSVGAGDVRWVDAEGFVVLYDMDRRLRELAGAVADARPELGAEGRRHRLGTDALPPRIHGYPAIGVGCLPEGAIVPPGYHTHADVPERVEPEAIERARSFCVDLVRLLDREVGRELESGAGVHAAGASEAAESSATRPVPPGG